MTPLEQTLLATIDTLTKTNESQGRQIEQLTARVDELLARIAWLQRKLFGRSSEKFRPDTHPSLFSEEELGGHLSWSRPARSNPRSPALRTPASQSAAL